MRYTMRACAFCLILASSQLVAATCADNIAPSKPDSAYLLRDNGTATDTHTGLMWQRCSLGQTFAEETCSGEAASHTWQEALALAASSRAVDFDDWRLPSIRELRSLLENCRVQPAINSRVFPNTPSVEYWSASPSADSPGAAWYVDFYYGLSFGTAGLSTPYRARLVRDPLPTDSADTPTETAVADEQPDPAQAESPED